MSAVDPISIARQMKSEANCVMQQGGPRCYWCRRPGPGLYWLPSEYGIIEMAVWNCAPCVVSRLDLGDAMTLDCRCGDEVTVAALSLIPDGWYFTTDTGWLCPTCATDEQKVES